MVYRLLNWMQRTLLTPTCVACGSRGGELVDLCDGCHQALQINLHCCRRCAIALPDTQAELCGTCLRRPTRYQCSYCAFEYGYPVAQFVRSLKYRHSPSHARVLGKLLAAYLQQHHQGNWPDCIVPVPLSAQRYRQRGFNQAIEIGRFVETALKVRMNTRLLSRVRHTIEQAGLSRRERQKNLRNAFVIAASQVPKHVAILDDVVTTGSTVNEIARTLKRAGVEIIEVWAVARASLH